VAVQLDDRDLEKSTIRRVSLRLVPFLMVCYFFALLDRVNVGFAALQMNKDLGLSAAVFGLGSSHYVARLIVQTLIRDPNRPHDPARLDAETKRAIYMVAVAAVGSVVLMYVIEKIF